MWRIRCKGKIATLGQVGDHSLVAACSNCEHMRSLSIDNLIKQYGEDYTLTEVLRRLKCHYCRHRARHGFSIRLTVDDKDTVKRLAGGRKGHPPGSLGRYEWVDPTKENTSWLTNIKWSN